MSYHRRMPNAATSSTTSPPQPKPKTLDADDASRLARLAYRLVLGATIDKEKALDQLRTTTAKQVGKAVLGYPRVDRDAVEMAERLKSWARRNAQLAAPSEAE